ncbi:MAG: sulfatase-like hydrolase/transferase [Planctomycetes bacterium]|jgi:choline-sulfatase|nr:sulfatase-like hydrolase/transferase [Planctomycetota bacterium]
MPSQGNPGLEKFQSGPQARTARAARRVPRRLGPQAALSILCAVAVVSGCGTDTPPPAGGTILVTLDTVRMDALSCYGAPSYVSPELERLARECVLYTNARSVAPLTLPAHASMLTGLYPPRHGLRDNGLCALSPAAATVAERARERGAQTAAFVSALVLDRAFALDQGFDVYDQPPRPERQDSSHYAERPAAATLEAARHWMAQRDRTRPFFLWVHLYDPHVPYAPPPKFLAQARGDAYRGEIASADAELGRFLGELRADGTLSSSFLAVTSDHGESLGEHGEPTHGAFCYDATLRIPLLLRYPDARRGGSRNPELVTLADLAPTLVEALGAEALSDVDGASLYDRAAPAGRGLYCESYSGFLNYGWSPLAGWISDAGKYLHSSRPEFFDLTRDGRETRDLFPEPGDSVREARLAIGLVCERPALVSGAEGASLPESLARDLRRLGYGASGTRLAALPHPLAASALPAPRDRADELEPLLIANALIDGRNFAEAAPILERIVAGNPGQLLALDLYGFALLQLERYEEARTIFERRSAAGLARADTRLNWALASERTGRPEEARQLCEQALVLDPENRSGLEMLLRLARARGDEAAAREIEARLSALEH